MKPKLPILFAPGLQIALNADDLPEWIQLAPFGEHPTRDKKRVQVLNAEAAAQIIQWFNFWPRKLARLMHINAVPIWVGHPDFDPDTWPERKRIGDITDLEARDDGLWGRAAWNAEASAALRDDGHKYPSVAWDCDEIDDTRIQPAFLWSVGMWRNPNIKSVQPVINAGEDTNPKPEPNMNLIEKIVACLNAIGLWPADAEKNEETVAARVQHLADERARLQTQVNAASATETELNTARETITARETRITELEGQVTQINAARIDDELTRLLETGRIAKADEETVRAEFNAGFDTAAAKYRERQIQLNTARLNIGQHKPAVTEAHERATRLTEWCHRHMAQTNCTFDEAWTASKTDPETKPLHTAAQAADEARAA